ncbi:hypothetical protein EJP67_09685 [Variovorax guangxiensis]|uniref:Uncharacterized protein n=1 Tax=Variovorax guangxiensis TaxID=1775474 RepID=A0A433MH13_9BURK|nr:hypothetical protein [Variovorax guangxiensis]RUR67331.1 hypothetical protein EJP67_09685 [Variovorax guangxiensis]
MLPFFRKHPVKLHLSEVRVLPRKDFLRHLEGGFFGKTPDNRLAAELKDVFAYPPAANVSVPGDQDVAIDVAVEGHSRGGWGDFSGGDLAFPIVWRPKVRISARVYNMKSGQSRTLLRVVERMSWNEYFSLLGSWRVQLGLGAPANQQRMLKLVQTAGHKLKSKIEAKLL